MSGSVASACCSTHARPFSVTRPCRQAAPASWIECSSPHINGGGRHDSTRRGWWEPAREGWLTNRRPHEWWQARATAGGPSPHGSVPRLLIRQLRQDLVDAEAVRLLTGRKLFESREELPDNLLRRQERPQLVRHPA